MQADCLNLTIDRSARSSRPNDSISSFNAFRHLSPFDPPHEPERKAMRQDRSKKGGDIDQTEEATYINAKTRFRSEKGGHMDQGEQGIQIKEMRRHRSMRERDTDQRKEAT